MDRTAEKSSCAKPVGGNKNVSSRKRANSGEKWSDACAGIFCERLVFHGWRRVGFHAKAGADEVAISVDVVHASDRRPKFAGARRGRGKRRELARVGAVPLVGAYDLRG